MSQPESFVAARAFARSLNILLKYIRLYGTQHRRTVEQLALTWDELSAAANKETGLLLGVAEDTLLIDGAAVDGLAERSFAALLKAAGISSIHFAANMPREEFDRCVYAFAAGKAADTGKQLRNVASGVIKINEVRFVAQDESQARASELVAQALGAQAGQMKEWLTDPEKLVQLIAAAEGSRTQDGAAPVAISTGAITEEADMDKVFRVLTKMSTLCGSDTPEAARQVAAEIPDAASLLHRALASLPEAEQRQNGGSIASLAEKLAIRFAQHQFERGEVKIDAVHQLMERMAKEIESLRKVLNAHEDKMQSAGLVVESYADVLDRQFWASMRESGKKSVLLSSDAWCIPARNVRSYVTELQNRGEAQLAIRILRNYARHLGHTDPDARKKTAAGLSELGDLYGAAGGDLLAGVLQNVGLRLQCETLLEQQTLLAAAYVRLTQEGTQRNDFVALRHSLAILERLQEWRPRTAAEVRPRILVENKLGEFISNAIRQDKLPDGLVELLRQTPASTAEHIAVRFSKCERCSERELYIGMVDTVGDSVLECLVGMLRHGSAEEAARSVGLVSRFRPVIAKEELLRRMGTFNRAQQDAVVRQLGAAGAEERGALLAGTLRFLDPLVEPEALDEIGLAPGASAPAVLLEMAAGEGLASGKPYIRVKAIEALGRLRDPSAASLLGELCENTGLLNMGRGRELRVAAAQALALIDPDRITWLIENGFAAPELGVGALPRLDTDWVRARRYPRVQPSKKVSALAITDKGRFSVEMSSMNLGGGLIAADRRLPRRGDGVLEWSSGLVRHRSHIVFRDAPAGDIAFEVVNINLESRARLRKMLAGYLPPSDSSAKIALRFATGSVRQDERTRAT